MATDLATLAIRVENGDVVKATTALDSLAVAGGKTEASTQRLTRRMALLEIAAREMDAEMGRGGRAMAAMESEARKLDAELGREARAMALVEIEARRMDAAMTASKQAAFAAEVRKVAAAEEALEQATRKADQQLEKTGKTGMFSAGAIKSAFAALGIGVALREFSQLSDTYTNIHARLGLVTTDTANLAAVQQELFDVSQRTRTAFEGTVDLYSKIARNAAQLGVSQRDVLTLTETVSKAMIISGGSAESNRATIVQFGQALASGTLRGDELNSVLEQSPRLAQALADGLGVTIGQLRQLGKDGKLTSEEVVRALLKMRDTIDKEFTQIPTTIGGAWQQLRNEILNTVGAANEAGGMSGGIVTAIDAIRNAIPPAFKLVNAFFGGIAIGSADAAVGLEKVRQKTAEIQLALGMALKGRGNPLGDFLIENAAKVLKDGDDILRMLEKQREEVIKNVHAITTAGTVSTSAPNAKAPPVVDPNTAKDLKALQDATDAYYNSLNQHQIDAVQRASAQRTENDELRAMIVATEAGQSAVEALTVAQAGANAVRQLGVGVTAEQTAAVRREAEEHARLAIELGHVKDARTKAESDAKKESEDQQRQNERRVRDMSRNASNIIADALDGLGKKSVNIFQTFWDMGKRSVNRFIADILGAKIGEKFGEMMGIGPGAAATKQVAAGAVMLNAATMQLQAATLMANGGAIRTANGITIDNATSPTRGIGGALGTATTIAGGALAGYGVGQSLYSTSHGAAGNYARGAVGGAAAGALLGTAIMPGIGTAVGAVAGFMSGILGVSHASKEAEKATRELRKALEESMASFRATVNHDDLGAAIAQTHAQTAALRKQIEEAFSGGGANSETVRERNRRLAEVSALEEQYIAQLEREQAVKQQRTIEDYQQRLDEATPGNVVAEAIAANSRRLDREIEDLVRSFGPQIDATEAATLAVAQQAIAAEKAKFATEQNTKALDGLTTSLHNAPQGYKYQRDVFDFATPRVMPSAPHWSVPTTPFVPPRTPLNPPTLSSASAARPSITIAPVFQIDGTKTTRAQVQQIGVELRKIVTETLGKDADVSEGWGLLA